MCYSDAHCTLSGDKNKCEFTIPGVFGFCVCDSDSQIDCPAKSKEPSSATKPNNSAFGKLDLKKKVPYPKRPWQTTADQRHRTTTTTTTTTAATTTTTTTTATARPLLRPVDRPPFQMPPLKRPVLKQNLTNNNYGVIKTTAVPATTGARPSAVLLGSTTTADSLNDGTAKPVSPALPTPSPIKIYLKSPPKDVQNKSQTSDNKTPVKVHKKPISTGNIYIFIYIIV